MEENNQIVRCTYNKCKRYKKCKRATSKHNIATTLKQWCEIDDGDNPYSLFVGEWIEEEIVGIEVKVEETKEDEVENEE